MSDDRDTRGMSDDRDTRDQTGHDPTAAGRAEHGRTAADRPDAVPRRPTGNQGPDELSELPKRSYPHVLRRVVKEYRTDNLTVWAAALTYYAVLSIFPGLLIIVSALRLFGPRTVTSVSHNLSGIAPGPVTSILEGAATSLQHGRAGTAGILAVVSLAGALWTASGYIGVFMKASNEIYDVPEGRPVWKTLPLRLGITVVTAVLLVVAALIVVFTGTLATQAGRALGIGSSVLTVWNIAKWPVLVVLISLLFAILYWASPNARHGGFRWVSPGGVVAVLVWLVASAGFAVYVARFSTYNRTYGSLAAVIVFLVWLWITNLAILLGAEVDAELQRSRAVQAGHRETDEPYLELRDTRTLDTGS